MRHSEAPLDAAPPQPTTNTESFALTHQIYSAPNDESAVAQEANGHVDPAPIGKVVVIGLSKTGTTTLKEMLTVLGYRVHGKNKELIKNVRAGKTEAVDLALDSFDAFKDWPWPLLYRHAMQRYGKNAKFILSTRISTEKWYRSVEQHACRAGLFKTMWLTYGYYKPYGRKQEFTKIYETHNEEVRRFFADYPDQFLEFCLERGDGWEKLCQFLGKQRPDMPVPHSNRADQHKMRLNQFLNRLASPFYRFICELNRKRSSWIPHAK